MVMVSLFLIQFLTFQIRLLNSPTMSNESNEIIILENIESSDPNDQF